MRAPAAWDAAPCSRPMARIGNIGELNDLIFRIANFFQVAFHAAWLARLANAPAMPDQLMRKNDPLIFRNNRHQVLFYFLGICVASKVQPPGQALYMSIDDYS